VGALAQAEVGDYLNKYFVSSYQKISNFTIKGNGQKQGGNVASYFCTPDGRVLHAVAGPVGGQKFLQEVRWVEETWKLTELHEVKTLDQLQALFREAHLERLARELNVTIPRNQLPELEPATVTTAIGGPYVNLLLSKSANQQAQVHLLLAAYTAPKLARVYDTVFATILNQEVSTAPVVAKK